MSSPHKGHSSIDTGADSGIQIIQRQSPSVIPGWVLINVVSFKYHGPTYSWFSLASRLYNMLVCNMAKKFISQSWKLIPNQKKKIKIVLFGSLDSWINISQKWHFW